MSVFRLGLAALVGLACNQLACAQEFNLFLACTGKAQAGGKTRPVHLDLAMRDNNETALIQRSNVLPVGERLQYRASPAAYSMVYRAPLAGTKVYHDWYHGWLFTWQPNLKRLATIRLSIDRQSGDLEGEILNAEDQALGSLTLACEPKTLDDMPQPRF